MTQQLTTIGNSLTDIVVEAIDKHNPEVIADWKDTGHKISTGVGAVGGAAFGGGNVGATAAGVVAGDVINGLASDASHKLADKISPNQQNPQDPKNNDAKDTGKQGSVVQTDTNKANDQNQNSKNQTYDTTTDINKVVSGIAHDVIVGSVGALAGIVFGGGNVGLDATAGGITSLKVAPKIEKPKDQKKDTKPTDTKKPTTTENQMYLQNKLLILLGCCSILSACGPQQYYIPVTNQAGNAQPPSKTSDTIRVLLPYIYQNNIKLARSDDKNWRQYDMQHVTFCQLSSKQKEDYKR
ncbi:hypothetical protein [Commensalibacter nepenthis]|uniref:Uncharacterized protein n=1 Tax=Commensalibacter nepenthis TaxID=3043872 RepID=A0ABT6QAC4_9PROT|nr:hypothetical protein [Commensalibacter sp. TBRC 10068]MDI2113861.1 hypothetical protein [Commensalibacter sp. TBRC 10068]